MALVNGTEDNTYIISEADLLADSGVEGTFVEGSVYVSEGSVQNNGNGTYTLTFPQNFSGTYQVYYLLNNGVDTVPWASYITVDGINDAPYTDTLSLELASQNEDSPYTISASDLLFYYTDRENDQLTLGNLTADHGTVVNNGNETFTITPDANYNGTMTLSFDVSDGIDTTPGAATYTINPVSDAPVRGYTPSLPNTGNSSTYSLNLSDLIGGFTDADGDTLSVINLTADHATLVDNNNGTWTVTPTTGYSGTLTYSYQVTDGGNVVPTTMSQTVINDNHAPTGSAPSLTSGTEDVTYTVTAAQLRAGFTDADGDTLTVQNVTANYSQGYVGGTATSFQQNNGVTIFYQGALVGGGYVEICRSHNGSYFTFARTFDANGNLVAQFNVSNPGGVVALSDGSFVLTQTVGNATNDLAATHYSVNGTVLDSRVYLAASTTGHEQGFDGVGLSDGGYLMTWTEFGTTNIVKYQAFDANGTARGTAQTVTASSDPQQNSKIAQFDDGSFIISWVQNLDIYAQRFEADGDSMGAAFRVNTTTASYQWGTDVAALEGGGFVVMWSDWLVQPATRVYQVYDSSGNTVGSEQRLSGSMVFWLANYTWSSYEQYGNVVALPDGGFAIASMATSNSIGLWRFDASGNMLGSQTTVQTESNGTISNIKVMVLDDGSLQVTWTDDYNGGHVWNRNFVNDPGGEATVTYNAGTGTYSITRPADTNGLLTVNYEVSDGHGGTKAASTTLNVNAVNDAPRGSSSTVLDAINEDGSITVSRAQLLAGYSDVDSAAMAIRNNTVTSSSGTVVYNGSAGTWTITPAANYSGSVTLTYTVWDGSANATTGGSLTFAVNAVNDAPALTGAKATISGATEDVGLTLTLAQLKQGYSDVEGNTISVSGVSANRGTITDNGNGTWSLTPEANYSGTVVISYTLSDGNGGTLATSLNISVAAVNDAPTGSPSATVADGTEDTTQVILAADLLAGFSDAEGNTLSVSSISADHGTLTATSGGWTFTPAANYNGPVTLTYTVSDGNGGALAGQTRSFTLAAVNDVPALTGAQATVTGTEDVAITLTAAQLKQGYSDADRDSLTVSGVSADHGTITDNGNGTWTLTPEVNYPAGQYDGNVAITYTLNDGNGGEVSASLNISVAAVNDAPTGSPSTMVADGAEDTTQIIQVADLLTGFSDVEGDTLSVSSISADHGTLTATDGGWTFTPAANYNGPVTLTYTVSDGNGGILAGQTRSFTLAPVNEVPALTGAQATVTGTEDVAITLTAAQLKQGYSDADGDSLTVSGVSADHGTITDNGDGTWTLTPEANYPAGQYDGNVAITYTLNDGNGGEVSASLNISVAAVNDAPTGSPSTTVADGAEDTTQVIQVADLLTGFSDVEGDTLSVSSISADHGTLTATSGGWTFTPAANYNGTVTLTYTVSDGNGGTLAGQTRSFTLAPVNDVPALTGAQATVTGTEDVAITLTAAQLKQGYSDADRDSLTVSGVSADHGTITDNGDGTWTLTQEANYNGTVALRYAIIDGNGGEVSASLNISVAAVNDAPTGSASGTLADGTEDTTQVILAADLLAGFSDAEGDTLSVSSVSADHGTLTATDGGWTFTPEDNYNGVVTLTYTVSDGQGGTLADQTLTFSLGDVNDAPIGSPTGLIEDGVEGTEQIILSSQLLAGFSDVENQSLSISTISADHGTITAADGGWRFTPEADYVGAVTLTYSVTDSGGATTSGQHLSFNLAAANNVPAGAPTAVLGGGTEDTAYNVSADQLLAGFSDADNDRLAVVNLTADHGTVTDNGNGTFTITPDLDYNGMITLSYDVTDGHDSMGATQSFTLAPVVDLATSSVTTVLAPRIENLTLTGTTNIDATGNELDNVLTGNSGANRVTGLGGNDRLNGAAGSDTMIGGLGNDTYVVDSAGDVVTELADQGIDTVEASIRYTLGANVENLKLTGTADNKGIGNALNNVLTGNSGDNALGGEGGNDLLDGGLGADRMYGGTGDDTFVVDNSGDLLTENAAEGTDTVQAAISFTIGINLENLTLTGIGNINGGGNSVANVLIGNAGNNRLDGKGGDDSFSGGLGDDTYVVDSSTDSVTELANQGVDTIETSIRYTLGANVENLTMIGAANIKGIGNALDNVLTGNSGDNALGGEAGNDVLDGGLGADRMYGGIGNDTFVVDNLGDQVAENAAEGTDTVQTTLSYTLGADLENLTLRGSGDVNGSGNALANVLIGNVGHNRLDGKGGADSLSGGLGDDTYVVDSATDSVTELADQGVDTVEATITYTLGANVENLRLTGTAGIKGTGNALNNVLTGNSGSNSLTGLGGNDVLDGDLGADWMYGGAGDDTFVVDNSGDLLTENAAEGTDTVQAAISFTIGINLENLTLTGSGNINANGNSVANILIGNAGNNRLDGKGGDDSFSGGLGDDTYVVDGTTDSVTELANQGVDTIETSIRYTLGANVENLTMIGAANIKGIGNALDNVLTGNSGDNALGGEAGNDLLDGGLGADRMYGGIGNDTFVVDNLGDQVAENAAEGTDTVQTTLSYTLGADLENLTLRGSGDANGSGNALANVLIGNAGSNSLDGNGGADSLTGGLGADIFVFGAASGVDAILDFSTSESDLINVSAYSHGTAFGAGIAITSDGMGNAVIDLGGGNVITVMGATVSDVAAHMVW